MNTNWYVCSLSAAPGTGTWHKVEYGERAARLGWLSRDSGLVIYQLKTTLSRVDGVHDVEARLAQAPAWSRILLCSLL